MRIQLPVILQTIRFGTRKDPRAQENAVAAGRADYGDHFRQFHIALTPGGRKATVYVQTNHPDPEAILKEAPRNVPYVRKAGLQANGAKFPAILASKVEYKLFQEPKAEAEKA
jgi:hypothetical protein